MGFSIKFNWVLQFDLAEKIEVGGSYPFNKDGNRVFPLDTSIDLIDSKRMAIAKIRVESFSNTKNTSHGIFKVVKVYTGEEQSVLSNYWLENE